MMYLRRCQIGGCAIVACLGSLFLTQTATFAQQVRVLGLDVSTYQGNLTPTTWATFKRATNQQVGGVFGDGRDFVIVRSSRGGTTGEDHRQGGYPSGNNTFFSASERYDDPYYVQNMNQATAAGLFAGSYHFARADIIASSTNSDGTTVGVANTGTDEADHFIQMAGPWMRPGYLPPVLDLEAGASQHTTAELSSYAVAFSDRIYQQMGIRPMIYVNSSYANSEVNSTVAASMTNLWIARPSSGDPLTTEPPPALPTYPNVYGVWNPSYPTIPTPQPWKFWQYNTGAGLNGYSGNIDKDAANGGMEFLKDYLVPAIWMNDSNGFWTAMTNWNSGQTPVAPVPGPGQLTPIGTQTLPTVRLPGSNDTVILDRSGAAITVTLDSGTHNIRKLYVRETLNFTGGSLSIKYVPSWDSTTNAAQFSGPVTLSGSAALSVHTLQVDATRVFTVNGGSLTFNTISLMPGTTPAKLVMGGDASFNCLTPTTATIANGAGSGSSGLLDLGAGTRAFTVNAAAELVVGVPVANGGLTKSGLGGMNLLSPNSYALGTTLAAGRLLVNNASGSGTGSGAVTVNGGTLAGVGIISGPVTVNTAGTISPGPGPSMETLTLQSAPVFNGTNFFKIDRNGGNSLADKLVLTAGTLNYGGTLAISNAGSALTGGEVFTNFSAPSYAGAFATTKLPTLAAGLNWYLGDLTVKGAIKVNRAPTTGPATFTRTSATQVQIPIANLLTNSADADGDVRTLIGTSLTTTNGVTLTTNSTYILYSNNSIVPDRFTYTISDGHGATASSTVDILPMPAPQFSGSPTVSSNSVTVHFTGGVGSVYYLERSTDLTVWVTISSNTVPSNGSVDYLDDFHDLAGPPSAAFYRLRW
jgi:GH25 family lysozyme M1 (1,4-beta-N-acetylmuramidase)